MSYHDLLPAQDVSYPEGIIFTREQQEAITDALNDERFLQCMTYREQCFVLINLLHDNNNDDEDSTIITYDKIGQIFTTPRSHGSIIKAAQKYRKIMNPPHRPYLLTDEEVEEVHKQLLSSDDYPTIEDIAHYIFKRFFKYPSKMTIKRMIKERITGYKIVETKPLDELRYDCDLEDIKDFYEKLDQEAKGVPVGFMFNLDESGQNQYQDSNNIYVVVPEDVDVKNYPISRATKRITLLHCISTDGSSCDPMIIVPRLTVDNELFDELTSQTVLLRSQTKGFCTHELFTDWFINKFLPYLAQQRKKYKYKGKAIIIMDGFKGHEKSLSTLSILIKKANIKIMLIPPHSSDQIQPLDLFGFNLQKSKTGKFVVNPYYTWQTNQILAIVDGLSAIRSPHSITTAWEMTGIYRTRITDGSVDDPLIQYHIIDITRNEHIRGLKSTKEEHLKGSHKRRKKYKVKEPTIRFPKKKEMKLKTPADVARQTITPEEADDLINLVQMNMEPESDDNCHRITEYFSFEKPKPHTNPRPPPKKRKFRIARLVLPSDFNRPREPTNTFPAS